MDERTRARNELDSLANEGHFVHDFVQFIEPALNQLHDKRRRGATAQVTYAVDRARARLGDLAPLLLSEGVELRRGRADEDPRLAPPPIIVTGGVRAAPRTAAVTAVREALDLLAAVGQCCYPEVAVGVIVTAGDPAPVAAPEIAWLPNPESVNRVERAALLMREAVGAWVRQLTEVEYAKMRSVRFGLHDSAWELAMLRALAVASLECELHKRLAQSPLLDPDERVGAGAERDRIWGLLEPFEPSIAGFLRALPLLPLAKEFVCTSYPCWDRAPFYSRAYDKWGKGPVPIHPLTPAGELLVPPVDSS